MLKRYIGLISPARIRIGGRDFGIVETGDAIAVSDDLANSVAWPEANWADGVTPKNDENDEVND